MRRWCVLAVAVYLLVLGCASGSTGPVDPVAPSTRIPTPGSRLDRYSTTSVHFVSTAPSPVA